ncbi:MAG: hypothetical protein M5U28_21085 [Sandaracinaceae bacterium]|nr:hypothetical protein [Sandaracinaceae bacterium]
MRACFYRGGFTPAQNAACDRFNTARRVATRECGQRDRLEDQRRRRAYEVSVGERALSQARDGVTRAQATLARARERLAALEAADR